jgi:hypothetical protein
VTCSETEASRERLRFERDAVRGMATGLRREAGVEGRVERDVARGRQRDRGVEREVREGGERLGVKGREGGGRGLKDTARQGV